MCTKQIQYQFSPLRGGYTFQATHAKSRESEMNIYTTFGRLVFYLFGRLVKYLAVQFSIYLAVWIGPRLQVRSFPLKAPLSLSL